MYFRISFSETFSVIFRSCFVSCLFQKLFPVGPFLVRIVHASTRFDKTFVIAPPDSAHQKRTRQAVRATACRRASTASRHSAISPAQSSKIRKYMLIKARQREASKQAGSPRASMYVLCCRAPTALCFYKKLKNVSLGYDSWVVETQLCKLRDTSDTLIGRACVILHL